MDEKTIRCPICGRPYKFYSMMAGDQSACPSCRHEAEQNMGRWEYRSNHVPSSHTIDGVPFTPR